MITLDQTTTSLEIVDSAAASVTEPHFVCSYVEVDNTGGSLTPKTTVGQANGATPVTVMAAPASGKQRQLKFLSFYNVDTTNKTVTIRFNNNSTILKVVQITLLPGEQLQYASERGWVVLDGQGGLKSTLSYPGTQFLRGSHDAADLVTALTLTSGTAFAIYLGRCGKLSSRVDVNYNLTVALGATISYSELGIFKGAVVLNGNPTLNRLGFSDISGVLPNGTGAKTVTVTLTSQAQPGDDLWAVFGTSTNGTNAAIRAGLADDLQSGVFASVAGQPSTLAANTVFTLAGATIARPWTAGYIQ